MGCVHSRKDINDVQPNEFCVINIDEFGNGLWSGQLEVMESELVLSRRGKEPTRWPLRSLRRYGFDGEIFSFESGRRCATGEGIYAFRCRRAEQLFNTLQQCIQSRNHNNENVLETLTMEAPSRPPGTLPRPPTDSLNLSSPQTPSEYLEPAPPSALNQNSRFSGVRLGSVSSGPLSPEVHSPGSPSSVNILEVMPLAPLPPAGAQVTNVYQLHDFPLQREHNNNKKTKIDTLGHSYLNTGDINTDLATLRHSLQAQQTRSNDDDIRDESNAQNVNDETVPLSPTLSTTSESYATLSISDNNRFYVNLAPGESTNVLPAIHEEMNYNSSSNIFQTYCNTVQTPKNCNFNFMDFSKLEIDEEAHNYANLGPGEVNYDPRLLSKNMTCGIVLEPNAQDISSQDNSTKINYAVLDLDKCNTEVGDNVQALPPSSPKKLAVGYTTIDFTKTEALTSVALGNEVDTEGSRKTRHNSAPLPPSPTIT